MSRTLRDLADEAYKGSPEVEGAILAAYAAGVRRGRAEAVAVIEDWIEDCAKPGSGVSAQVLGVLHPIRTYFRALPPPEPTLDEEIG